MPEVMVANGRSRRIFAPLIVIEIVEENISPDSLKLDIGIRNKIPSQRKLESANFFDNKSSDFRCSERNKMRVVFFSFGEC